AGGYIRRRLEDHVAQHIGNHFEALAIWREPGGIPRREFRYFLFALAGADLEVLSFVERQKVGEPALDDAQAVPRQVQIPDDLRIEQGYGVSRHGIAKARMKFFGYGRAAHHGAPFEHRHLEAGRRQVRRTHEPVVSAVDDDDIARLGI